MVNVPVPVPVLAVTVRLLAVVAELGLNAAVTPLGRPEADRATLPENPFKGVIVTAAVVLNPSATVNVLGEAERLKSGGGVTVSATVVELLRLPEVPLIVIVEVPALALPLAVNVRLLVDAAELGLNDAVTPVGSPEAVKFTVPAKPFCGAIVTVVELLAPWTTVRLLGDADRLKLGATLTVSVIAVVRTRLPEVPVTVTVNDPAAAEPLAAKVSVLVLVAVLGLNDAVTPLGNPDAARLTLPENPFCAETVIALDPLAPCTTVRLFGDAERVKFGAALTVSDSVVVCTRLPEVPVIVTTVVPTVADALAVRVKLLVVVAVPGLNDAVTPPGNPEAARLTFPVNPFSAVTAMVLDPLEPCTTDKLFGDDERLKSGGEAPGVNVKVD
jgi:hypothetical protein